eukprot:scaffold2100_cov341-Prasinococcus_capsulatus_cf.AAC.1
MDHIMMMMMLPLDYRTPGAGRGAPRDLCVRHVPRHSQRRLGGAAAAAVRDRVRARGAPPRRRAPARVSGRAARLLDRAGGRGPRPPPQTPNPVPRVGPIGGRLG